MTAQAEFTCAVETATSQDSKATRARRTMHRAGHPRVSLSVPSRMRRRGRPHVLTAVTEILGIGRRHVATFSSSTWRTDGGEVWSDGLRERFASLKGLLVALPAIE